MVTTVIDIGCGLGRHVAFFAEKGYSVVGVDIAESAVETSRDRLKDCPQAEAICGDATRLQLLSNSFQLPLAWRMIHLGHTRQVDEILGEVQSSDAEGALVLLYTLHIQCPVSES